MGMNCIFGITVALSLSVAAQAAPTSPAAIQWFSCPQNESVTAPYECGTIQVPLDYTDTAAGTLDLKMVRVNHTKEPFMGSMLFNSGGPGLPTRPLVAGSGAYLLELTGGHFDLIGHDPRGAGDTLPFVCYNASEIALATTFPSTTDSHDVAVGQSWSAAYALGQSCAREHNSTGSLVGTAFTVRDMFQIVDALGEDGLLRYWGFSYGSPLGATAAAMFPDRIDKLIIDAVLNMNEYYSGKDIEQFVKTDASFRHFLDVCVAAGDNCVLSQHGSTADELETNVYQLLDDIRREPLNLGPLLSDIVRQDAVKTAMLTGLRTPVVTWPSLATMLHGIFSKNLTAFQEGYAVIGGTAYVTASDWPSLSFYGASGVRCSDSYDRASNLTDVLPHIRQLEETSVIAGGVIGSTQYLPCARWPYEAKERITWTGNYTTKNPLLIIGNTWDPLSPVESAFNTSSNFPGSGVIHQNSGGHGSIAQISSCTNRAILEYLINGTIPDGGSVFCEPDEPLAGFVSAETQLKKRALMTEKDRRHADAMHTLAKEINSV